MRSCCRVQSPTCANTFRCSLRKGAPTACPDLEQRFVPCALMKLEPSKLFAPLLLAVVACNQPSVPFESLQIESSNALCTAYVRCGVAESDQNCRMFFSELLNSQIVTNSELAKSIADGRIKYDGMAAHQCIAAMQNAECGSTPLVAYYGEPQCHKLYRGTLAEGQPCKMSECAPGLFCEFSNNNFCEGKCQKQVEAGGDSSSAFACAPMTDFRDGKCAAPSQLGGSCSLRCADNLNCVSGKCVKPSKAGDSCEGLLTCGFGLDCVAGKCDSRASTGDACNIDGAAMCNLELVCSAEKKCKPAGREGDSCALGEQCAPQFVCDGATASAPGSCKPRGSEGESCERGTCRLDLFCDLSAKSCKQKLPAGSACDSQNSELQCQNSFCSGDKCVSVGATCSS